MGGAAAAGSSLSPVTRRALAVALIVLLAACGGGDDAEKTSTTKTTEASTTTTAAAPAYPLTGLPITDPAIAARPALVVKIDNADGTYTGRPQQGINEADVVYEEMVEGSVTRFAAVFHSRDAVNRVVPVRSARSTDVALFTPLRRPLFAWSGANKDFAALIRASAIVDVGYDAQSGLYRRDSARRSPVNLWTTTELLWSKAPPDGQPPPALFTYRPEGTVPEGAEPKTHAYVNYGTLPGSAPVDFRWDDGRGVYLRFQKGSPHVDEAGVQVAPRNVIIQITPYRDTGGKDVSGHAVFEAQAIGSGEALVLTAGKLIRATWTKTALDAVTTFTDASGAPVALTPGQTWVLMPQAGTAVVTVE